MKQKVIGFIVWLIYRILSTTWKLRVVEPDSLQQQFKDRETVLFAHWHGDELALLKLIGHYRVATIASSSKDGEIMNTVLSLFGVQTTRGSSTRGGASALKGLLRVIKQGSFNSSMAVDGPKGPIYEVKPGIFEMSRLLKAPIYSAGVACDRAWRFEKSWNQTYLPKPFAKVVVQWSEALPIVDTQTDPRSLVLAESLKNALHHSKELALKELRALQGQ